MEGFYFLSVSAGKNADDKAADDFLKKLKLAFNGHALAKNVFPMRSMSGVNQQGIVVQVFPSGLLYENADSEMILSLMADLEKQGPTVRPPDADLIQVLLDNLSYTHARICGKCCPCRLGGPKMIELLGKMKADEQAELTIPLLREVAFAMQQASMCAIGMFGADPVLFALKNFWAQGV